MKRSTENKKYEGPVWTKRSAFCYADTTVGTFYSGRGIGDDKKILEYHKKACGGPGCQRKAAAALPVDKVTPICIKIG